MTTTHSGVGQIATRNPATGATIETFEVHDRGELDARLDAARAAFSTWRTTPHERRAELLRAAGALLRRDRTELAELATREMGKPIAEAEAEVDKCARACDWFAGNGARFIESEVVATNATRSYVAFRPLGVLLAIMPWNFPYWQVFRAACPALTAGNVVVLKHAANVTGCALRIEQIFREAGFPAGTFTTIVVAGRDMDHLVADERVAAVTLTGSEGAGSAVGAAAGKAIKKVVLELGGSDYFIVLRDADLDRAAEIGVKARFQNTGQSCIAAKRFIVEDAVYDAFLERFVAATKALTIGDPMDRNNKLGPLARHDLRDAIADQVDRTVKAGGRVLCGGKPVPGSGAFYEATVVADVPPDAAMAVEETFGPAAAVFRVADADAAVELANASRYGLGGNVWTRDIARAEALAERLESGNCFINGMTASDPRLPFGGVKMSGYGRELAHYGLREFVNVQTVWIGPDRESGGGNGQPAE